MKTLQLTMVNIDGTETECHESRFAGLAHAEEYAAKIIACWAGDVVQVDIREGGRRVQSIGRTWKAIR